MIIKDVKNINIKNNENGLFVIKFIIDNIQNVIFDNVENIDYNLDNNIVTITSFTGYYRGIYYK